MYVTSLSDDTGTGNKIDNLDLKKNQKIPPSKQQKFKTHPLNGMVISEMRHS